MDSFPEAIAPAHLVRIQTEFEQLCKDCAHSWYSDPDDVRSIADDITTVGAQLSVNVDRFTDRLLEMVNDLESESNEGGYEPDDSDEGWRSDARGHEDFESMFEGLLREINESGI